VLEVILIKARESKENKYMKNDKGKNKMELTIEESVYILKRKDFNMYVENRAIETLLTAYEKEKEKNNKLMEKLDLTTVYISGVYDGEKKVKDKIKAEIEEVNYKMIAHQDLREAVKQVLNSLLEKE